MKMRNCVNRRNFIAGTGLLIGSFSLKKTFAMEPVPLTESEKSSEKEVSAVEDLMREHGALRRILIVYSETAKKFLMEKSDNVIEPVNKAAKLFRDFGENYHEKMLEETYIFPAIAKTTGEASNYPEILIAQHRRGREITEYILSSTNAKKPADVNQLVLTMDTFVRMYRPHAAREDTIVFPAWKQILTEEQLEEMSEKFEDIEHEQFGENGFEKSVKEIADIESRLGLADLSQFTAPPVKT